MDQNSPNRKKCEFDNVTPAELIASKFLSLIGRSTGDYELNKKIRKSNMTIETITDLIHEYLYDRLNDSNNSNDPRKENGQKNPVTKEIKNDRNIKCKHTETTDADNAEHPTGQDNIYAQLEQ